MQREWGWRQSKGRFPGVGGWWLGARLVYSWFGKGVWEVGEGPGGIDVGWKGGRVGKQRLWGGGCHAVRILPPRNRTTLLYVTTATAHYKQSFNVSPNIITTEFVPM